MKPRAFFLNFKDIQHAYLPPAYVVCGKVMFSIMSLHRVTGIENYESTQNVLM